MKVIYIILSLVVLAIVIIFSLSFFFLDQQRHQSLLYALYDNNVLIGYENIDKYHLENRVIYKSFTELPRDLLKRGISRKISFDERGKDFVDYTREISISSEKNILNIAKESEKTSFLHVGDAYFSCLEDIPVYGNDVVFEINSIATYIPVIRRYNFRRRGTQFVNVLMPNLDFLPPVRKILSITSAGYDVIEIEGREVHCEHLLFGLKNGHRILVWVTKSFHNILAVEAPEYKYKAVLSSEKETIPVEEYRKKSKLYTEKEVMFKNEDIALYGTLSLPTSFKSPYPTLILIWDSGPMDRNALGIFTDMAHGLAESGYSVLRFDKRGIGQSQGFFSTYAQPEEISDLRSAINFLKSQPEVDSSRMALLGHSEGGLYAAHAAALDKDIKACIIMSAVSSFNRLKDDSSKLKTYIEKIVPDDPEYLESAVATIKQARELVRGKLDWITILGKSVFTKKIRLEDKYNPLDIIRRVKVPVLILHGRKDEINLIREAQELADALAESGNDNFTTIFYGDMDHVFGKIVKKSPVRDHIEVDPEVLNSMKGWLENNLLPEPPDTTM